MSKTTTSLLLLTSGGIVALGLFLFTYLFAENNEIQHGELPLQNSNRTIGPETERFFDRVNEAFKNLRSSDPPMTGSQTSLADLNRDGIEDSFDLQIIQQALDTCRGEENFSPEADLDFNGCVTSVDYKMFTDVFNK